MAALSQAANRDVVLVIDDDPFGAEVTARLLDFLGYRSLVARRDSADGGAASAIGGPIAAVVLNVVGLGGDYDAAIRRTRELGGDAPIVLCTADPREDVQARVSNENVAEIISKPYLFVELQNAVRKAACSKHAPSFSRPISP